MKLSQSPAHCRQLSQRQLQPQRGRASSAHSFPEGMMNRRARLQRPRLAQSTRVSCVSYRSCRPSLYWRISGAGGKMRGWQKLLQRHASFVHCASCTPNTIDASNAGPLWRGQPAAKGLSQVRPRHVVPLWSGWHMIFLITPLPLGLGKYFQIWKMIVELMPYVCYDTQL